MSATTRTDVPRLKYHPNAYQFVFAALRYTQQSLGRVTDPHSEDDHEEAHITPQELLLGIRDLTVSKFGLMSITVLNQWGIRTTDDFGRIVFELIECGEMRKTDRDHVNDFASLYEFADAFDRDYHIDLCAAFSSDGHRQAVE